MGDLGSKTKDSSGRSFDCIPCRREVYCAAAASVPSIIAVLPHECRPRQSLQETSATAFVTPELPVRYHCNIPALFNASPPTLTITEYCVHSPARIHDRWYPSDPSDAGVGPWMSTASNSRYACVHSAHCYLSKGSNSKKRLAMKREQWCVPTV